MEGSSSRKTRTSRKSRSGDGVGPRSRSKGSKSTAKRRSPKPALESFNPATGELVGTVETLTPAKVQGVVDEVAAVQPFWAALSLEDRARYMRRAGDVLLEDLDEIAELLTNEQGKPRVESYTMEVLPTVDSLKWIADNGPDAAQPEASTRQSCRQPDRQSWSSWSRTPEGEEHLPQRKSTAFVTVLGERRGVSPTCFHR